MCALCSHTQNMPHAMKSGERHEVCGVRDSVSKLAGADHHGRSMSPRGTPATQTTAATTASNGTQARHQSQRSAISARPARQDEGQCRQVPRLPRKVKVDVTKCHACHTNSRGDNGVKRDPTASPEPAQCHKRNACHAKWYVSQLCVSKLCV